MTNDPASTSRSGRRGLHGVVVDQLAERIVRRELPPGTRLPNEAELSAQLAVSRTVVREAVKVLAAKGLVEARPRTGTRVLARTAWQLMDADVLDWHLTHAPDEAFYRDIAEVRRLIEPAAARLAAKRRTADDAARLTELTDALDAATDDIGRYVAIDLALHGAILEATHNDLLARLTTTVEVALRAARQLTTRIPGGPSRAMAPHRAVVEAIVAGQPDDAGAAMEALLDRAARDIVEALEAAGAGERRA